MLHLLIAPVALMSLTPVDDAPVGAYLTGKQLYEQCTDSKQSSIAVCAGYLMGIADALDFGRSANKIPQCIPGNVGAEQLRELVVKSLKDHPDDLALPAAGVVSDTYRGAWLCK